MITTGMLKRQVWIADDDEFEKFTEGRSVMFVYGTYVLEGEAHAKFYLGDTWNLFWGDTLTNNPSNFCRQMINCMKVWNFLEKTLDLPLNTEIIRQAHGLVMEDEKDVLAGKGDIKRHQYWQAIIFLHRPAILKDTWKTQFLGLFRLKKMI